MRALAPGKLNRGPLEREFSGKWLRAAGKEQRKHVYSLALSAGGTGRDW